MDWNDIYGYSKELISHLTDSSSRKTEKCFEDENLLNIIEHLKDSDYLNHTLKQRGKFDYNEGYWRFKRRILWKRGKTLLAVGAVASIMIACGLFIYQAGNRSIEIEPVELATDQPLERIVKAKAFLETADGNQIALSDRFYEFSEEGKVKFTSDSTGLQYTVENRKTNDTLIMNSLIVPRGGMYQLTLADGTKVYMNSDSKLVYPVAFTGDSREVVLTGEAYFEVAKDNLRPFIVNTDLGKVRVYGTQFNVKCYQEEKIIVTTLVEGKIGYSNLFVNEVKLTPGWQVTFTKGDNIAYVQEVDVEYYVGWKNNNLCFKNESLENIMRILSRWYDLEVVFQDEWLKTTRFSGVLDKYESIGQFLRLFECSTQLHFKLQADTLYLKAE